MSGDGGCDALVVGSVDEVDGSAGSLVVVEHGHVVVVVTDDAAGGSLTVMKPNTMSISKPIRNVHIWAAAKPADT